ncbi:MAG TPA: tetratricopeptide repeat protein [Candidatus Polarisedimenticolia bacterium]|nr:tetratricopeptide repeat protein [Candidatus Polarisedimenticolia bacterium]
MPARSLRILLTLALLSSTPAFADLWYESYKKGEDALARKNWREAIDQFTQAIEKKGDSGVQVRTYGMNFINYHPYLGLGIAYLNLGQIDAALQAFDTEERLGAIARSPALAQLKDLRARAQAARETAHADDKQRIARLVATSLREAGSLEQERKLDEAVAALGKGLAADPQNAEALAAMERLRGLVAEQEKARGLESRLAELVADGKSLMSAGKYEEASSAFSQALSLKPDSTEAKARLAESQAKLREAIQAQGAGAQEALVRSGMAKADEEAAAGRLAEALQSVQRVLAVDPKNRQALEMQARLARQQAEADRLASQAGQIADLLESGERYLKSAQYDQALARFNRAIALDPANATALGSLGRVYTEMNRALLGTAARANLPPAIVLTDLRTAIPGSDGMKEAEETSEQVVSSSQFTLSGTVVDDQATAKVVFLDGQDQKVGETTVSGGKFGETYITGFAQTYHLNPGRALLKVVATDPDGLAFTRTYQVRYDRPFTRSPWFYAGAALLAAGLGGGLALRRVRRRNRLLKRRFNPYVAGAPVLADDLFVGREALLSRILETIHNNSILLYGERRIGKTSLQHHLRKRLQKVQDPDYEFFPVFIDLQGTPQERFFATLAEDIHSSLAPILDGAIPPRPPAGADYDHNAFTRDVYQVLEALKKRSAKRVKLVLLIDEVDELNNYDPRVNQRLRSLFMKSFAEDLVAVVSGVGIKKQWASEGSPWYNFFEEIEVRPFTRRDAEELIEKPIQGIFRLERGAVDRIIENTGCKPYLIQKTCISLVNRMHDERRRRITIADVDAVGRMAEA